MVAARRWRNWQTRRTQNPVPSGACGFDSHPPHSMTNTSGILTGGGDCPGLNAVIRAVVRRTEPPADPTTQKCPECLSEIPLGARRCAFCTATIQ